MTMKTNKVIDKNFLQTEAVAEKYVFHNALIAPFELSGFPFCNPGDSLKRLPDRVAQQCNQSVQEYNSSCVGGMIRFRTNSKRLAVRCEMEQVSDDLLVSGANGCLDFYHGCGPTKIFYKLARMPVGETVMNLEIMAGADGQSATGHEWTVYLPTAHIKSLEIGIAPETGIFPPTVFADPVQIVFYGSSITQGASVSRNGNRWAVRVGRMLDCPIVNFGFGGGCRGDLCVADAIGSLSMRLFVMEYDHNSDTDELAAKHEPFFRRFRQHQPQTPVLILSASDYTPSPFWDTRLNIIRTTYSHALADGDRNVFLLPGGHLLNGPNRGDCTVDGIHPNDYGAIRYSERVVREIARILNRCDPTDSAKWN